MVIDKKNDSRIIYAIREPSEIEFLQDLQKYMQDNNNILKQYDWCFSRIVENVDSIYIPYFDSQNQVYRKFYPDFIFWLRHKQSGAYKIIFIGPKGLEHTANSIAKADGFEEIFKEFKDDKLPAVFLYFYNKSGTNRIGKLEKLIKESIKDIFVY